MFLKCNRRPKDGKVHHYWNVVESRRLSGGRVVQRQVLYLGEINESQREAWRKTIEVLDKFKTIQMVDVHVPTADGRQLVLSRYTEPEPEHRVLLDLLRLKLPEQPPPKITARQTRQTTEPCPV